MTNEMLALSLRAPELSCEVAAGEVAEQVAILELATLLLPYFQQINLDGSERMVWATQQILAGEVVTTWDDAYALFEGIVSWENKLASYIAAPATPQYPRLG